MKKIFLLLSILVFSSTFVACNKKKENKNSQLREGRTSISNTNGTNSCNQSNEVYRELLGDLIGSLSGSPASWIYSSNIANASNYILRNSDHNEIIEAKFSMRIDMQNKNNSALVIEFWDDIAQQNNDPLYVAFGNTICGFRVAQELSGNRVRVIIFDSLGAIEVDGEIRNNRIRAGIYYHSNPNQITNNPRRIGDIDLPVNGIIY